MAHVEAPTARAARLFPDATALVTPLGLTSYGELERDVVYMATVLRANGVRPGDRIALAGENTRGWVAAAYAIPRTGAVLVPLNDRLAAPERDRILTACGARPFESVARGPAAVAPDCRPAISGRLAVRRVHTLLFTSGSCGDPKGVMLTWGNHLASAVASRAALALTHDDVWLCAMPLFHAGGLAILYRQALVGGAVALLPRFDDRAVAATLAQGCVTLASFTATMFRRLRRRLPAPPPALRAVLVGGEAVPEDLRKGPWPVRATYGLTEAASHVTIADCEDVSGYGRPVAGMEIAIRDGRIAIRGAAVMRGYFGRSPGLDGNWFDTGDPGEIDDSGHLRVPGRRADLIVSGGENISPAEVEAALAEHPGVVESAVVPIPDAEWGQAGLAYVVRGDRGLTAEALRAHLRARLGGFKVPAAIRFCGDLPRTASGKVDRRVLADHGHLADVGGMPCQEIDDGRRESLARDDGRDPGRIGTDSLGADAPGSLGQRNALARSEGGPPGRHDAFW
ncbi:MAG: acyl--CoA ligase [Candidatus Sericytochromatia bacterium]|uniref:Acyl--CoA ligase n=1 Tax=Candidatus Tanganyikabacteria bacterium TaxID=2961651 RepID=A0A937X651_9BACT|nr:acyl--CoA ligase [Candidatus Tanganyikabacteria bacterium]